MRYLKLGNIPLLIIFLLTVPTTISAQTNGDALSANTLKSIKKEAKKLVKGGWDSFPGDPSIEEQLIDVYIKRAEKYLIDETKPRWVFGDATATVNQLNIAKDWSMENAKSDLMAKMGTLIEKEIQTNYSDNKSIKIESVKQDVSSEIKRKLEYTEHVLRIFRQINGTYEVTTKIIYKYDLIQYAINKQFDN